MASMKGLFYFGWVLLGLAFVAAAAQVVPRMLPGGSTSGVVSAYELWYAAWPGSLVVTQIKVEKFLHPWLWDPMLVTVLKAPAWLLVGLPGGLLTWFLRPNRQLTELEREDLEKHEDALRLFDQLAREAEQAGYGEDEDDRLPDHTSHGLIDGDGVTTLEADYDLNTDGLAGDEDAGYAGPKDGDGGGPGGDGKR
jgi:hypothetical protein